MKAALHEVEGQRLAALWGYDILDTPRESDFDDVVRVVSKICDAPISVINLIDNGRQWFKAEVGLGVRETPIDSSICAHAILQKGLMIVPDTTKDPRFTDNPLVTGEPHLRFYAGALLETPDGLPLGTVCVLDYEPRSLDDNQRALLELMANQVMKLLELRRVAAAERLAREHAQTLLAENAMLARESDHRVMNSLQLVQAVLGLQARGARNADVRTQLETARDRVSAIATVHRQLHLTATLETIDMAVFLEKLCENLGKTAPATVTGVTLSAEPLSIPSALASNVGLIVAELIINSFKHAYTAERRGAIAVVLQATKPGWRLTVSDSGIGLPDGFDLDQAKGVGMRIIASLVRRLDAELSFETSQGGTHFIVQAPA